MATESKGSESSMPSFMEGAGVAYELACFDSRGRAEAVRLFLSHLKVKFNEQVVKMKKWSGYKKNVKCGTLPVLFDDLNCVEVGTDLAILRYISAKHGNHPFT